MERFVCQLSRWMTLAEVATVSGLGWESVKEIVKSDLGKRYARIPLKDLLALLPRRPHSPKRILNQDVSRRCRIRHTQRL